MFAIRPSIGGKLIFPIVWIFCLSALVVSMRTEGFENIVSGSDIDSYIMNMSLEGIILPYHWREFVWWVGSRYLYQVTGDATIVFLIYDSVLILATYFSMDLIRKTFFPEIESWTLRYLYFCVFLFFPFPLGMHNTYRQILALAIFLFAFGNAKDKVGKSIGIYAVSFFIHNAVILLAPVYLLVLNKFRHQKSAFALLVPMIVGLVFVSSVSNPFVAKSVGEQIGQRIPYIYLIILLLIFTLVFLFEHIRERRSNAMVIKLIGALVVTYFGCFAVLESQALERVFFMVMVVLFPILGIYFESRFKPKPLARLVYLHFSISPLFLLYTTAIPLPF